MKKVLAFAAVLALVVCMAALAGCSCSANSSSSASSSASASSSSASSTSKSASSSSASSSASSSSASSSSASSSSSSAATVKVPDVMGASKADAQSKLESAGLSVSFSGASDGYVVGQSIAAGASVNPGTTVTVTIKGESPEPGQNPVMNFIGKYGADRATALVEAVGEKDAKITVEWASSASSGSTWVMQGTFDESKLTVKYTKGTKTDYEYADEKTKTETVVYTDGTGTITFSDSGALSFTWADDKEHVADGVTFKYAS